MLYFIRVDDDLRVQITDNALARDLFPQDYHCLGDNENRPIKWLAIESLLNKAFSTASDVVSKSTFFGNFLSTQEPKSHEVFITFAYAYNRSKSIKRELIIFRSSFQFIGIIRIFTNMRLPKVVEQLRLFYNFLLSSEII